MILVVTDRKFFKVKRRQKIVSRLKDGFYDARNRVGRETLTLQKNKELPEGVSWLMQHRNANR